MYGRDVQRADLGHVEDERDPCRDRVRARAGVRHRMAIGVMAAEWPGARGGVGALLVLAAVVVSEIRMTRRGGEA